MARSKLNNIQENFGGAIQSITNTGSAGGTLYYINLGGLKLLWGITNSCTTGANSQTSFSVTLPSGFFTTIQSANCTVAQAAASVANNFIIGNNYSTSSVLFYINNQTASPNVGGIVSIFVIGT